MAIFDVFLITSLLSIFRNSLGEVNLKIILQPPFATLECTITHNEEASVILMCPNDTMCFQNCVQVSKERNISCSHSEAGSVKIFTYVFNTHNSDNQGEWTCNYGSMKAASVIFFKPSFTTKTSITYKNPIPNSSNTISSKTPRTIIVTPADAPSPSHVNPYYVVLLLVIFSISLLINILFLVRDMLTSISTRKALHLDHKKNYSCWLALCIKIFCLEKILNMKSIHKSNIRSSEINPLLSRQVSSNIYEHSGAFHFQSPVLLENFAYAGTPLNERIPLSLSNNFIRSKSFPVKSNDTMCSSNFNTVKVVPNKNTPQTQVKPTSINELSNQIIYDDVAEPSLHCISYESPIFYSSLARPNQRLSRHISMQNKIPLMARSMSNLNLKSKYPSDSMIGDTHDADNESLLKEAINSRVELSKEMINQADNLLRQADTLLNKRDSPKNN